MGKTVKDSTWLEISSNQIVRPSQNHQFIEIMKSMVLKVLIPLEYGILLQQTVCVRIWYQLFLWFWMVHTWIFAHWRHQRAVSRLENVRQLNERWGKRLDISLLYRHPHKGSSI